MRSSEGYMNLSHPGASGERFPHSRAGAFGLLASWGLALTLGSPPTGGAQTLTERAPEMLQGLYSLRSHERLL